jgi:Tol biopolymer transport system component/pimeloyl-ACP methyl ester carboxylesterase
MTDRDDSLEIPATPTPEAEPVNEPIAEAPRAEQVAAEPAAAIVAELTDPGVPGPANPSPDGAKIAFLQADADGLAKLWIQPVDGGEAAGITLPFAPVVETFGPAWSPDGATLALTGADAATGKSEIWLVAPNGDEIRKLVEHAASDRSPRWSPDGTIVAFVSRRGERDAIAVAPADGIGGAVQLTHAPIGQDDREPCWSTDGERIAFTRRAYENNASGDHIWTVALATGETKQVTKKLANRRSLRWAPNRAQLACIADDAEWENVAVINPDNSAGWNVASEAGDKSDPSYSSDGSRVLYTRRQNGVVRICDRGVNAASPDLLDPGEGVASNPRWIPGDPRRVVYLYQPATGAPRLIVQEAKKDVTERTELPPVAPWSTSAPLLQPTHQELTITAGLKLGGLYFRDPHWSSKIPGVLYLGDKPYEGVVAGLLPDQQALVGAGFAVFSPSLPGTPGYGKKVTTAQRDITTLEDEITDLADAIEHLANQDGVDAGKISIVGRGYGGALALILAGARPGLVKSVAAIDPIVDWDAELDDAGDTWRAWHLGYLGLPAAARMRHSLYSVTTFVGAIDVPALIIGTDSAGPGRAEQLELLKEVVSEIGSGSSVDFGTSEGESRWQVASHAAAFVREVVGPNPEGPAEGIRDTEV